jgi:hypothetical protein
MQAQHSTAGPDLKPLEGRSMMRILKLFMLWTTLAWMLGASAASAETLTFLMRNNYGSPVEVEFYSKTRSHVWPGNGQIYPLGMRGQQNMRLSCQYGEQICYGAWLSGDREGIYWGVGPGAKAGCDNCCYTCQGGVTREIGVNP